MTHVFLIAEAMHTTRKSQRLEPRVGDPQDSRKTPARPQRNSPSEYEHEVEVVIDRDLEENAAVGLLKVVGSHSSIGKVMNFSTVMSKKRNGRNTGEDETAPQQNNHRQALIKFTDYIHTRSKRAAHT